MLGSFAERERGTCSTKTPVALATVAVWRYIEPDINGYIM